jgi:hypothetical protein
MAGSGGRGGDRSGPVRDARPECGTVGVASGPRSAVERTSHHQSAPSCRILAQHGFGHASGATDLDDAACHSHASPRTRVAGRFLWPAKRDRSQGNGQRIGNYGGPGGFRVEFIPAYNLELIVAAPPYATASGPKGDAWGWGDYPLFLAKYRFLSANKDNGDYIVTGFFQMTEALNTEGKISNHVLTAQPTIAAGKGWGDFDIQSTLSVQIPVQGHGSPGDTPEMNRQAFGDPILWNTAFQYHFMQYFWPEVEINYEYWPNGEHVGLN